jgi:hypothetical protein
VCVWEGGRALYVITFDTGECWLFSFLSSISTLLTPFSTILFLFSTPFSLLLSLSRRVSANDMGLVVVVSAQSQTSYGWVWQSNQYYNSRCHQLRGAPSSDISRGRTRPHTGVQASGTNPSAAGTCDKLKKKKKKCIVWESNPRL